MKIRKGDHIYVIKGKDRGKSATVSAVLGKEDAIIAEGVNVVKKAVKKGKKNSPSGIVEKAAPISVSNVQVVCPGCNKGTRVGYKVLANGSKERICKRCGGSLKE